MGILRAMRRPEYWFNPVQIWRRIRRDTIVPTQLAWGLPLEVPDSSFVGNDIRNLGVHDRMVPEAIYRLLDPGEYAMDIGANIGQNTSMMALAAGSHGQVIAFEPGAQAWSILSRNVERWGSWELAPIRAIRKGVSSREGTAVLHEASDMGSFTLEATPVGEGVHLCGGGGEQIELIALDSFLPEGQRAGLIKIDVEGHELAVLEGAGAILKERRVRDIVFEDFQPQPSAVTSLLQSAGYTVFYLYAGWGRPVLAPMAECAEWLRRATSEPNFLATLDPERAERRFRDGGWKSLRTRARRRA